MGTLSKSLLTLLTLGVSNFLNTMYIPSLIKDLAMKQMDINSTLTYNIGNISNYTYGITTIATLFIILVIWRKEINALLKTIKNNI